MARKLSTLKGKQSTHFLQISNGIDFDRRLFEQEIKVQRAWIAELAEIGIFSRFEMKKLNQGLTKALHLQQQGKFPWKLADEDIHMNLERFLTESCGNPAQKIHLGRSRNDLIATTLRLFIHQQIQNIRQEIQNLIGTLLMRAAHFENEIIPAFTHQQAAQPIRMGQMFLAYGCWFERDLKAFTAAAKSTLHTLPLGSAACGGTHLPINLSRLAKKLNFANPPLCSYDAIGDRDFLLDFQSCTATFAIHLARLCNDIIYLSSTPLGIFILPPKWSSGSSMMPNKRNPDLFEIMRAKSARMIAANHELQMLLHSLPSGYVSDLHEAKRIAGRTLDEIAICLQALAPALSALQVDSKRAKMLLNQGHILATDIANRLIIGKRDFRSAYHETARLVKKANRSKRQVHELLAGYDFIASVESRNNLGGSSLTQLRKSIHSLRNRLEHVEVIF